MNVVIGDATIIIIICYILAGLTTKRKIEFSTLLSTLVVMCLLHLILLR